MGAATDLSFSRHAGTTTNVTTSKDLKNAPTTITITELSTHSTAEDEDAKRPESTLVLHPSLITQDMDALRFDAAAFSQLSHIDPDFTTEDLKRSSNAMDSHKRHESSLSESYSTLLISSPYNIPGHHLNLTNLPLESLLFAKALTALQPIREDYATAPYTLSLNFDTVLSVLRSLSTTPEGLVTYPETSFYVVVFRSKLRPGIDKDWLFKLDAESHAEACESGGLLKYWFGKTSGEERNLATCTSIPITKTLPPSFPIFHLLALALPSHLFTPIPYPRSLLYTPLFRLGDRVVGKHETISQLTRHVSLTGFWHSRSDAQKGGQGPWHKKARAAGRELYEEIVFSTHRFTVLEGAKEYRFEKWRD